MIYTGKLYSVVSMLVRCCDVSGRCQSSVTGQAPIRNPHGDPATPLCVVPSAVEGYLFGKPRYTNGKLDVLNNFPSFKNASDLFFRR